MRTRAQVLGVVASLGVLCPIGAEACSCPTPESWWDSKAPIIFHAKILATELTSETERGVPVVSLRYQLIEQFRGDSSAIRELRTVTDTGMCGVRAMAGDNWIVHTNGAGFIWLCSGSLKILPKLDRDEVVLGKLREAREAKK